MCAALPGGNPNYKSADIFGHMSLRHGAPQIGAIPENIQEYVEEANSEEAPPPPQNLNTSGGRLGGLFGRSPAKPAAAAPKTIQRAVDTSAAFSTGRGDHIWEYVWKIDKENSTSIYHITCGMCKDYISFNVARAFLPCGHSFHETCLPSDLLQPPCPICQPNSKESLNKSRDKLKRSLKKKKK